MFRRSASSATGRTIVAQSRSRKRSCQYAKDTAMKLLDWLPAFTHGVFVDKAKLVLPLLPCLSFELFYLRAAHLHASGARYYQRVVLDDVSQLVLVVLTCITVGTLLSLFNFGQQGSSFSTKKLLRYEWYERHCSRWRYDFQALNRLQGSLKVLLRGNSSSQHGTSSQSATTRNQEKLLPQSTNRHWILEPATCPDLPKAASAEIQVNLFLLHPFSQR